MSAVMGPLCSFWSLSKWYWVPKKNLFWCKLSDFQSQCPDQAATQSQESESSLGTAQGWTGQESWRVEIVAGPADTQLECVVSWWNRETFPLIPSSSTHWKDLPGNQQQQKKRLQRKWRRIPSWDVLLLLIPNHLKSMQALLWLSRGLPWCMRSIAGLLY